MFSISDNLAVILSPASLAVVFLVAVLLIAPGLMPVVGRILGRIVGFELRRRYGVRLQPQTTKRAPAPPIEHEPDIEVLPPSRATPTLRAGDQRSLAPTARSRSRTPVWLAGTVVAAAVAVLSWLLLHSR